MYEYLQSVNNNFSAKITQRSGGVALTLQENGFNYPHVESQASMDSIKAENMVKFKKEMKNVSMKLSKKLPDGMKPESEFVRHLGFTDMLKGSRVRYAPFSIDLEDGQRIIALARQYDKDTDVIDLDAPFEVAKWFLNEENITSSIHASPRPKDMATAIKRLTAIVEHNHKKFVKENPDIVPASKEAIEKLKNEIVDMKIDVSNVVDAGPKDDVTDMKTRTSFQYKDEVYSVSFWSKEMGHAVNNLSIKVNTGGSLTSIYEGEDKISNIEEAVETAKGIIDSFADKTPKEEQGDKVNAWIDDLEAKIATFASTEKLMEWRSNGQYTIKQIGSEKVEIVNTITTTTVSMLTRELATDEQVRMVVEDVIEIAKDRKDRQESDPKLLKTAEFIKNKTGVDYEIKGDQAHFVVGDKEVDIDANNNGAHYFTQESKPTYSIKERWLSLVETRKRAIELILKNKEEAEAKQEKATIKFNSREDAEEFATAFSRRTGLGHTISGNNAIVDIPNADTKAWINFYTTDMNAKVLSEELQKYNSSLKIVSDGKEYMVTEVDGDEKLVTEGDEAKMKEFIEEAKRIKDKFDSMITPANIMEKYPTMSGEQKLKWQDALDAMFQTRIVEVANALGLSSKELYESGHRTTENVGAGANVAGVSHFGQKDILQPIEEYIAEIKASDEYKAYLAEKEQFAGANAEIEAEEARKLAQLETEGVSLREQIENDETYKQIMSDSFNGVMYNASTQYDAGHLLDLWNKMSEAEKESSGGAMKGAMGFLKEQGVEASAPAEKSVTENFMDRFSGLAEINTSEELEESLDKLYSDIETLGREEEFEDELNKVADRLTELMKSENE